MGLPRRDAHQLRREAAKARTDALRRVSKARTDRERAQARAELSRAESQYKQANKDWRSTLRQNTEKPHSERTIQGEDVSGSWGQISGHPGFKAGEGFQAEGPGELYWIPVSSSNVNAISWQDASDYKLWVRFHNGSVYAYDAPEPVYDHMFTAASMGRFVHQVLVKGGYPYRRVY